MANLVLYRKHRPQTFTEVIGQEHVVRTLTNALSAGQTGHAYLFCGPRGTGKTTMARLLAKALNCQNRKEGSGEPCNMCTSCKEIVSGRALDLLEIDAASNRGIDEMRELREGIRFVPVSSAYKIFVIDECHQLTKEAANALLKTLEEPPAHAVFILATTEAHKVLPTIISRCQRFEFRYPTREELKTRIKGILKKEKRVLSDEALGYVLSGSGGSVRDAESILGAVLTLGDNPAPSDVRQLLGIPDMQKIGTLVSLIAAGKKDEALSHINTLAETGQDMEQFTATTVQYMRGLLLSKINPAVREQVMPQLDETHLAAFEAQRAELNEAFLHSMLQRFITAAHEIKYSALPQLPLELAIVDMCPNENLPYEQS